MGIDIGGGGFSGIQVPGIHYAPNPLDEQQKYIDALTQWKQSEMARQTAADQQTHANATAWDNTQYNRGQDALAQQTAASNHQDALAQQQAQLAQQATLHQDTLDQRDQAHKDREQDRQDALNALNQRTQERLDAIKEQHDAALKAKQADAITKHSQEIEKIIGTGTNTRLKQAEMLGRDDLVTGIPDYVRSRTDPNTGAWTPPPPPPDLVGGTVSAVEGGNPEGGNPDEAPQVAPNGVQPIPPVDIDQEIAQTRAKKAQDKATRQTNIDAEHADDRNLTHQERAERTAALEVSKAATQQHLKDLSDAKRNPYREQMDALAERTDGMSPQDAAQYALYEAAKNHGELLPTGTNKFQDTDMNGFTATAKTKINPLTNQPETTAEQLWLQRYHPYRDVRSETAARRFAKQVLNPKATPTPTSDDRAPTEEEANAIAAQAAQENGAQYDGGPDGYNEKALAMQAGKSGLGQPGKGGDLTVNPQRTKATAAEAGAKPAETKDTSTPPATLPQLPKGQKWVRRADNKGWTAVKE